MANKIKRKLALERELQTMVAEGILSIQAGLNPRVLEEKLRAYAGAQRPAHGEEGRVIPVAKKQHHEEHENHERWLVSYADFITLLFAFFVVMYSTSRVDNKRMQQVVHAIKFAMHFKGTGGIDKMPIFEGPPSEGGCIANVGSDKKLQAGGDPQGREPQAQAGEASCSSTCRTAPSPRTPWCSRSRASASSSASRRPASSTPPRRPSAPRCSPSSTPSPTSSSTLNRHTPHRGAHRRLARQLLAVPRQLGPLLVPRAAAVASYIQRAYRVDGKMLSAAGYSSTRPLEPNDAPGAREANRRVEMAIELGAADGAAGFGH